MGSVRGMLDTESTPGKIVVDGPCPLPADAPSFQAWLLWAQLEAREKGVSGELAQRVFEQSLTRPWATLGLVATGNYFWFIERKRLRPFLRVIRQYWNLFAAVGPRYTGGTTMTFELWSMPNNVKHVLANLGIPKEILLQPLPPGGINELIDHTELHLCGALELGAGARKAGTRARSARLPRGPGSS